jgi:PST family polysaccharide transporter
MHFTTVCSVGGRLLATVGIFCFVHEPDDVALAALLQASATALSGALSAPIVSRRLGLSMMIPRQRLLAEIRATLRDTRILAFSEYVTSSVANSGVFVLGLFAPDAVVGVYAALEKVARSAASVFEPLLKALFPGMSGRWMSNLPDALPHSLAWTKRILFLALLAAGALYALGPLGLEVLFGRGWETQAALLRILSFWLLLGVTASVLGQFWLLARGKQSAYSRCLVAGSATQLVACLPGAAFYGIYGVVVSLVIAEFARLALFALALRDRTTRVMP